MLLLLISYKSIHRLFTKWNEVAITYDGADAAVGPSNLPVSRLAPIRCVVQSEVIGGYPIIDQREVVKDDGTGQNCHHRSAWATAISASCFIVLIIVLLQYQRGELQDNSKR